MGLKIRSDQSVLSIKPSIDELSGSIYLNELFCDQTSIEPFKPVPVFCKPSTP